MSFDGADTYTIEVWTKPGLPPYFEFYEFDYIDSTNCPIEYVMNPPLTDYDP